MLAHVGNSALINVHSIDEIRIQESLNGTCTVELLRGRVGGAAPVLIPIILRECNSKEEALEFMKEIRRELKEANCLVNLSLSD